MLFLNSECEFEVYLCLDEVSDSDFGHYGDCDSVYDLFDHFGIAL